MNRIALALAVVALSAILGCGDDSSGTGGAAPAPTSLTVVESDGGAHLTWKDNSTNEAKFVIERKTASGDWAVLATVPFNTTAYHDASVSRGASYVYRVMAVIEGGGGSYSNEVSFTAPADGSAGAGGSSEHAGSGAAGAAGGTAGAAGGTAGAAGSDHMEHH